MEESIEIVRFLDIQGQTMIIAQKLHQIYKLKVQIGVGMQKKKKDGDKSAVFFSYDKHRSNKERSRRMRFCIRK